MHTRRIWRPLRKLVSQQQRTDRFTSKTAPSAGFCIVQNHGCLLPGRAESVRYAIAGEVWSRREVKARRVSLFPKNRFAATVDLLQVRLPRLGAAEMPRANS